MRGIHNMDAARLHIDGHIDHHSTLIPLPLEDLSGRSLGIGASLVQNHASSHELQSFQPFPRLESCVNQLHIPLLQADNKLSRSFASPLPSPPAGNDLHQQVHGFANRLHLPTTTAAVVPPSKGNEACMWDHILNHASSFDACNFPVTDFSFCNEDCPSDCESACDGECPSQCGDTGQGVCCDDACGPAELCIDEACQDTRNTCTDEGCLTQEPFRGPKDGRSDMTDGDKAAAAALASFVDFSQPVTHDSLVQPTSVDYGHATSLSMPLPNFPASLPCGSLTFQSIFPNVAFQDTDTRTVIPAELTLANHIMQYHDRSCGLALSGDCLANYPSRYLRNCTLPVFHTNDTDPCMPHVHPQQCGFQVQDPNSFAHHIIEQHAPALTLQLPHFLPQHRTNERECLPKQSSVSSADRADGLLSQRRHCSPLPSPVTNCSSEESNSETPITSTTPQADGILTDPSSVGRFPSPRSITASQPHGNEDPFLCRWVIGSDNKICGERFEDDAQLQKHCRLEHIRPMKKTGVGFQCGWIDCARDTCFSQRSKVERHMQVHTGYKPVKCDICGAALSAKQALEQHMRIHTGETPWQCKVPGCGCAFKQQSALTMHERTHTGDKPLECEICHKRFSESSNLSKHRRTHNVKGMHECQLCGKDFHRLDQLRRHMGTNHKDRQPEVDALLKKFKSEMQAQRFLKSRKEKELEGQSWDGRQQLRGR